MQREPTRGRAAVLIPNFNGANYLRDCLRSLSDQTYGDLSIIVIDNGSRDPSADVCAGYASVRFLPLGENRGFSAAINEGIRASDSEYVVLLNNDTNAAPDWLEKLVRALDERAEISFASSKLVRSREPELIDSVGHYYSLWGRAGDIGQGEPASAYIRQAPIFGTCAAAAIYRRSLFEDIGLFDDDFFLFYEDIDIDMRAAVAGHRCMFVPGAVVYHHRGGSYEGSGPDPRVAIRNRIWVAGRSLPFPLLVVWFLLQPIRGVLWFAARRLRIGPSAQLRQQRSRMTPKDAVAAVAEALRTLPAKRLETRSVRRLGSVQILRLLWETRTSRVRKLAAGGT